jgi:hypothetical protein
MSEGKPGSREISRDASSAPVSRVFWIAALLPLLGYVGSIGLAEAKRWGAPTIRVQIEGYDPRDPIRGHYLNYRISRELRLGTHSYASRACAMSPENTSPETGLSRVVIFGGTVDVPDCVVSLPHSLIDESHRFYVQQDHARQLEDAVRSGRGSVQLRLVSVREVTIDELFVDGQPYRK